MQFRIVHRARGSLGFQLVAEDGSVAVTGAAQADVEACVQNIREVVMAVREGGGAVVAGKHGTHRVVVRGERGVSLADSEEVADAATAGRLLADIRGFLAAAPQLRVSFPPEQRVTHAAQTDLAVAIRYDLEEPSTSGRGGLELVRRARDELYSAHVNAADGTPVLFLRGFPGRHPRDEQARALLQVLGEARRYRRQEGEDRVYFVVTARNGRELARSRWFADRATCERAIAEMIAGAPAALAAFDAPAVQPRPATGYLIDRPSNGSTGFESFRADDRRHYFHVNGPDGAALLFSHGYSSARERDTGMRAVIRVAMVRESYQPRLERAPFHFVVLAANSRELARSRDFASREEAELAIRWLIGAVPGLGTAAGVKRPPTLLLETEPEAASEAGEARQVERATEAVRAEGTGSANETSRGESASEVSEASSTDAAVVEPVDEVPSSADAAREAPQAEPAREASAVEAVREVSSSGDAASEASQVEPASEPVREVSSTTAAREAPQAEPAREASAVEPVREVSSTTAAREASEVEPAREASAGEVSSATAASKVEPASVVTAVESASETSSTAAGSPDDPARTPRAEDPSVSTEEIEAPRPRRSEPMSPLAAAVLWSASGAHRRAAPREDEAATQRTPQASEMDGRTSEPVASDGATEPTSAAGTTSAAPVGVEPGRVAAVESASPVGDPPSRAQVGAAALDAVQPVTAVSAGAVNVEEVQSAGPISVSAGVVNVEGSQSAGPVSVGAGAVNVEEVQTAGPISVSAGAVNVEGVQTAGPTSVGAGAVKVDGGQSGTGAGSVAVNSDSVQAALVGSVLPATNVGATAAAGSAEAKPAVTPGAAKATESAGPAKSAGSAASVKPVTGPGSVKPAPAGLRLPAVGPLSRPTIPAPAKPSGATSPAPLKPPPTLGAVANASSTRQTSGPNAAASTSAGVLPTRQTAGPSAAAGALPTRQTSGPNAATSTSAGGLPTRQTSGPNAAASTSGEVLPTRQASGPNAAAGALPTRSTPGVAAPVKLQPPRLNAPAPTSVPDTPRAIVLPRLPPPPTLRPEPVAPVDEWPQGPADEQLLAPVTRASSEPHALDDMTPVSPPRDPQVPPPAVIMHVLPEPDAGLPSTPALVATALASTVVPEPPRPRNQTAPFAVIHDAIPRPADGRGSGSSAHTAARKKRRTVDSTDLYARLVDDLAADPYPPGSPEPDESQSGPAPITVVKRVAPLPSLIPEQMVFPPPRATDPEARPKPPPASPSPPPAPRAPEPVRAPSRVALWIGCAALLLVVAALGRCALQSSRAASDPGARSEDAAPTSAAPTRESPPARPVPAVAAAPLVCPEAAAGDAALGIVVGPFQPVAGEPVRVLAATLADEAPIDLQILGADHRQVAATTEVRAGVPSAAIATATLAEGEYTAVAGRAGAVRCQAFTVGKARRPVKPAATTGAWAIERAWSPAEEALYSAWVRELFAAPDDVDLGFERLDRATSDPRRNLLHDALRWGEDSDPGLRLRPDGADLPYALRGYWAWKRGLPFAFRSCSRGEDGAPRCTPTRSNLAAVADAPASSLGRIQKYFQRTLAYGVHTGNARAAHGDEDSDFYPVALSRKALRPGTIYADPYGPVLVLVDMRPPGEGRDGVLFAVDAQADGTITRAPFWRGTFLWSADAAPGGIGFKRFRPVVAHGNSAVELGDAAVAASPAHSDLWLGYAELTADDFYRHVEAIVTPGPRDPLRVQADLVDALARSVHARVDAVERAGEARGATVVAMPKGFEVFETDGTWASLASPGRDLRLLVAIDAVRGFADHAVARPDLFPGPDGARGDALRTRLVRERERLLADPRHAFKYRRSDGSEWTLSLAALVDRGAALEVAYNPNDCPEVRWGAPEGSAEARTCTRRAPAEQQARMDGQRGWFRERVPPRRGASG